MTTTTVTLNSGRTFEVARTPAWDIAAGDVVIVDDGDTIRARTVERSLGAGMVLFDGEDRICQMSGTPLVVVRELSQ